MLSCDLHADESGAAGGDDDDDDNDNGGDEDVGDVLVPMKVVMTMMMI